jgi:hypothetical protein
VAGPGLAHGGILTIRTMQDLLARLLDESLSYLLVAENSGTT